MEGLNVICGEKDNLLIVILCGRIRGQEVPKLEELEAKILGSNHELILCNFRDVATLMPGAHGPFAKFQQSIRSAGKLLGICSLKPEMKAALLQSGLVRESELFNNVAEGWARLKDRKARMNAEAKAPNKTQKEKPQDAEVEMKKAA